MIRDIIILLLLSLSFGTVTDIDGNVYETVYIGSKIWMAENLKVTHYRNGDEIPTGYSNVEWSELSSDAFAIYDNDTTNIENYGYLYNWYAIDDERGICPEGWYIPSDDEYKLLEMHLGMSESDANTTYWRGTDEGGKLKEEGLEHWDTPNTGATNESGFTGLPGGARDSNGSYFNIGGGGYYWTSSTNFSNDAWYRLIAYNKSEISRLPVAKRSGQSVRCITYESETGMILVPQEFLTIQAAIEAASDGDTVLVSAGTYFDHLNFNGKDIVVAGENKETTIIDGSQNNGYGVVHFASGEDSTAVLSGFTLQNGYSLWGAGIRCEGNSSPTLKDLIITNNLAQGGGGMFITEYSDPTLIRVAIIDNSAYSYFGGGMYIKDYSDPKFINVTISGNSAEMYGGGMYIHDSSNPTLMGVTISSNTAGSRGGGIHISGSSISGSNLLINNNYSEGHGAGIFISAGSDINLNKSTISSNMVGPGDTFGAGIYADGGTATLINSIVYYNTREGDYGINYNINGYTMDILNEYTVSYSDIEGDANWIPEGEGNISIAPEVNDFENGDFTLQPSSPCIDAGDPSCEDPDGSICDMGAYPYFHEADNCIDLHEGNNLISFSTLPIHGLSDMPECIYAIAGEGIAAMNTGNGWVGSLTELSCEDGYWLENTCDDFEWCYSGVECSNPDYSLHEGNNLISYLQLDCGSIGEVLPDDVEECIYAIAGEGVAALSTESGWVGSLSALCPDEGYWFVSECDIDFTYDEPSGLARKQVFGPSPYPYSQSSRQAFYFMESVENIEIGDWILAYSGNKVIGARQWQGGIIDVPAMGDDGSKYTEGYMESGTTPVFKVQRGGKLINLDGYVPAWSENGFFTVSSLAQAKTLPETFSLEKAYPNPFNPITTISFALPEESKVILEVYGINGRLIIKLADNIMKPGYHSVIWNADSHSSGVYFIKMVAGEYTSTQKLILVK